MYCSLQVKRKSDNQILWTKPLGQNLSTGISFLTHDVLYYRVDWEQVRVQAKNDAQGIMKYNKECKSKKLNKKIKTVVHKLLLICKVFH